MATPETEFSPAAREAWEQAVAAAKALVDARTTLEARQSALRGAQDAVTAAEVRVQATSATVLELVQKESRE